MAESLWDHVEMDGLDATAAKSKRPELQDTPQHERMRAGIKPAQQKAPSSDQKKVQRQQARTAEKESEMTQPTEADLLNRLATATTLTDQSLAAEALSNFRMERVASARRDASIDWDAVSTPAAGQSFYLPPTTAGRVTHDSDWLQFAAVDTFDDKQMSDAMRAEATLWYEAQWDLLKADPVEMHVATSNASIRAASPYGLQSTAAAGVFVEQVNHLHRKAGLTVLADSDSKPPWLQDKIDGKDSDAKKDDDAKSGDDSKGSGDTSSTDDGGDHPEDEEWATNPGASEPPVNPKKTNLPPAFLDQQKKSSSITSATVTAVTTGPDAFAGGADPVQPPPYNLPNGSDYTPPSNQQTFDGLVNDENKGGADPKTDTGDSPSLGEGSPPASDTAGSDGVTPPLSDTSDNTADNKSTTYTDPLPTGGKGASLTAEKGYSPCPNHKDQSFHTSSGMCSCGSNHRQWASNTNPGGKKSSLIERLRSVFADDNGLDTSDSPSLATGTSPEGDTTQSPVTPATNGTETFDASTWAGQGQDPLPTGGTGNAAGGPIAGTPTASLHTEAMKDGDTATCHCGRPIQAMDYAWYHLNDGKPFDWASHGPQTYPNTPKEQADADAKKQSALTQIGQRVSENAKTANVVVFGRALASMASLDEERAGFTGNDIVAMVLASGDITPEDRDSLSALASGVVNDADHAVLDAKWRQSFDALNAAGLEADADHPIAADYRAASDAVNHANRSRDFSIMTGQPTAARQGVMPPFSHEGAKSDVCPKCGSHMSDVKVSGNTMTAKCGSCGWHGTKTKKSSGLQTEALQSVTVVPLSGTLGGDPKCLGGLCTRPATFAVRPAGSSGQGPVVNQYACDSHVGDIAGNMSKHGSVTAGDAYNKTEVHHLPDCDICEYDAGKPGVPAQYDGKTIHGPWANMCEDHFQTHGTGLGFGVGQRLIVRGHEGARGNDFSISDAKNEDGEWIMSPEEIRAEMAYGQDPEDPDDFYND